MNSSKKKSNIARVKIAVLGSRGIPARYGGYETIAQDLSVGLANAGFEVYVSCESKLFKPKAYDSYEGVRLVYFPVIGAMRNISEVFIYDLISVLWATLRVDIIYMLGYSSAPVLIAPRAFHKVVAVNVDGLEAARRKFNTLIRFLYRSFEKINTKVADYIIVDSRTIGFYYKRNYAVSPIYIPNGVKEVAPSDPHVLRSYRIEKGDYYLVIARLIPDNNIDLIIEGYKKARSHKKLVIVGPLERTSYVSRLLLEKNDKILFLGGIYELKLQRALRCNCFAYIHGHEMGGTNPSLVEALSCRNTILAIDVPFTREVAEDTATYFKKDANDLKKKMETLESATSIRVNEEAYEIYKKKYSVKNATNAFVEFVNTIVKRGSIEERTHAH